MVDVALSGSPGLVAPIGRPQPAGGGGLAYDGRVGPLFRLWLKLTLLTLLTLGVYRFWAHARLRKYLWSRISLDGERFEYDGTGGELFRRFFIALLVLTPVIFAPQIAQLAGVPPAALAAVSIAQAVLLVFLAYLGYYTGRRYRLSRTLWSGIRGWLEGHAALYALYAMLTGIATVLTLGLYTPWQRVILWRYEARHTLFGDSRFAFDGRGKDLLGAMLLSMVLFVAALIGAVLAMGLLVAILGLLAYGWSKLFGGFLGLSVDDLKTIRDLAAHEDWKDLIQRYAHLIIVFVMAYFVVLFLFVFMIQAAVAVAFSRFRALWFNYMAGHTRFAAVQLSASVSAWSMFRLLFGNMLLQVLTLGLARPFVAHRMLRFACAHLTVSGLDSLRSLRQSSVRPRPSASGLAQLLDTGGFT